MNDINTPFTFSMGFQHGQETMHIQISHDGLWELQQQLTAPNTPFDKVGFIKQLRLTHPKLSLKNALAFTEAAMAIAPRVEEPRYFNTPESKFSKIIDCMDSW